jgi:hypothetical protein
VEGDAVSLLRPDKRWKYHAALYGTWLLVIAITIIVDIAAVSAIVGWTGGLFGGLLIAANEKRTPATPQQALA